jgi:hypothetical protein
MNGRAARKTISDAPKLIKFAPFGPAKKMSEATRIWRWVRTHEWPEQIVLVLGAVAIAAVMFVFGLLVGAGIAPWLGG